MALQSQDTGNNEFGANMNFKPVNEIHSPPDSRKRTSQHEKGQVHGTEEPFVQPEPPKKHKATLPTNLTGHAGRDQNPVMSSSPDHMGSQPPHSGSFLHQELSKSGNSDDKTRLESVLRELGQEMKMVYLKWSQPFAEGEAFEALCPTRLDELLKEALRLEQHLKKQKEQLRERLMLISQTLQLSMP
ncbi:uncharacterized protein [Montipora foliosa]|uniref:uncharacterized protein n=1 Tax=Montipora foliosa TaxID=591990 RepID=UPI0035F161AB